MQDHYAKMAASYEEVRGNFERFGVMGDNVRFLVGWFKDTLPVAPIDRLAVMRLDGDYYEFDHGRSNIALSEIVARRVRHH